MYTRYSMGVGGARIGLTAWSLSYKERRRERERERERERIFTLLKL